MNVTIDVSAAVNGRAGLGRYAEKIAASVAEQHPDNVDSAQLFANFTKSGQRVEALGGLPLRSIDADYKPWRMAVWAGQQLRLPFNRLIGETDVFHATEHLLMPLRGVATVLTVHDLIFKLFPKHHKKLNYWYLNAAMPLFVQRADHVIAVSECTKRDLMEHYGTPAEKISVIYEAAAAHFMPQTAERIEEVRAVYDLPAQYLIHVGTIEPRKNLARLVEALAILRRDDPDLRLVVVGSMGWLTESFTQSIERFGQSDAVIRPGYVPDEDLPAMLAGAAVAVIPSLYEGFGLPVIEAMACGVPVACSSTSSVGEIAGDAAMKFDPTSIEEMVEAISAPLYASYMRNALREKGLRRASEFSWERAAAETWAVYEQVLLSSLGSLSTSKLINKLSDKSPKVRENAASHLGFRASEVSILPLLNALELEHDISARTAMIEALGSTKNESVVQTLISLLADPEPDIRAEAAYALGYVGNPVAIAPLIKLLHDDEVRLAVARALGELRAVEAIPYLLTLLNDHNPNTRGIVVSALGNIGDDSCIPSLSTHLSDADTTVVTLASHALERIGTPEALAAVEAWRAKRPPKD